jgi:hypothetical protein
MTEVVGHYCRAASGALSLRDRSARSPIMSEAPTRAERVAAYVQRIAGGPDFPALSNRIRDIMQVLSTEDMTMQRLANIILKDYSLTTKVLQSANSFHYNRAGTSIFSVTQAMVLLGMGHVRDLASSLLVFEHYQAKSPGLKELMLLSMLTASHAQETAEHVGYGRPEEAYIRGMFRNLGEVLIACHGPADYAAILVRLQKTGERPATACLHVLGFTYEELGEAVCQMWGITPATSQPKSDDQNFLDRIVAFSHELTTSVYRRDSGDSPATLAGLLQKHGAYVRLTPDLLHNILQHGITETKQVFDGLSISIDDLKLRRQSRAALAALEAEERLPDATAAAATAAAAAETEERLMAALESTVASSEPFDLNHLLLTILEAMVRLGPFDRAIFCLANADRTEMNGRFGLGDGVEDRLERTRFLLSSRATDPVAPALLRGADVLLAAGPALSAGETQLLQRLGVQMLALLPIMIDAKLVGALYADRVRSAGPPSERAKMLLQRARSLARRAIVQARARAQEAPAAPVPVSPAARYDAVLRVLKGEPLENVSRSVGATAADVQKWRDAFLDGALTELKDN